MAINAIFGDNGLINSTNIAKIEAEKADAREQLELVLADAYMEKKLNKEEYNEKEYLDKYVQGKNKEIYIEEDEIGLNGYIFELDRSVPRLGKYKGQETGPRIREIKISNKTTNSVTIEVDARNAEDGEYTYSYQKVGETEWQEVETSEKNTCTIEGLEANESYTIKVKVETKNGTDEEEISTTIGELPKGTITFGEVEWVGDGTASVAINTSEEGYQLQYQKNSIEGEWTTIGSGEKITGLKHNDTVYARLYDGVNGTKDDASISIQDKVDPVVTVKPGGTTTNSITVSVVAVDNESGMADSLTYTYYIKKTTEQDTSYTPKANNIAQNSYTFTGLQQETSYDVKVEVTGDKAGRTGTGTLANQTTIKVGGAEGGLTTGAIVASAPTWSSGEASITLTTSTGMQIQYQVGGIEEGQWTTVSTGATVSGLHHNDTVYARLYDGTNTGDYGSVSIIDNTPPTVSISTSNLTYSSVTLKVTASDNESGLATSGTYKYYLNSESSPKETSTINSYNYTGLTANTSHTLKVIVTDKAGKTTEKSITITTEKAPIPENTSYVGYYADVDGNGSVDGVIYADLAIGESGQWGNSDGIYTIPKGSNFKKYEISKKDYTDDFGTKDVIKVANVSGNERFYVMALDDVDSSWHSWYYNALYHGMSDYASTTSTSFGSGKQNTKNMIAKWNSSSYGSTSSDDMWGLSTVQSKINENPAWYVPSREEWAVFGRKLDITEDNYHEKGLGPDYWSSSAASEGRAWIAELWWNSSINSAQVTRSIRGSQHLRPLRYELLILPVSVK